MKKTTKRKITTTAKRVVKPPSQSVVLSLMALILIVGAPAIVSMIDDSYNENIDVVTALNDDVSISVLYNTTPEGVNKEYTSLINETDVSIAFSSSDALEYINYYLITSISTSVFDNADSIKIYTTEKINTDYATIQAKSATDTLFNFGTLTVLEDSEGDPIGYEFSLSSYEKVLMKNKNIKTFTMRLNATVDKGTPLKEFDIQIVQGATIPYAEIIIGATGAILIMCAIFATPWFGLGGITAKPRRSK